MTSDSRGRLSLQFFKIIDALYILKVFTLSGVCAASSPSGRAFCFYALRFAAAASHRPTNKLHQAGMGGVNVCEANLTPRGAKHIAPPVLLFYTVYNGGSKPPPYEEITSNR